MADENGCHKHILVALSRPRPFQKVGEKNDLEKRLSRPQCVPSILLVIAECTCLQSAWCNS